MKPSDFCSAEKPLYNTLVILNPLVLMFDKKVSNQTEILKYDHISLVCICIMILYTPAVIVQLTVLVSVVFSRCNTSSF